MIEYLADDTGLIKPPVELNWLNDFSISRYMKWRVLPYSIGAGLPELVMIGSLPERFLALLEWLARSLIHLLSGYSMVRMPIIWRNRITFYMNCEYEAHKLREERARKKHNIGGNSNIGLP